MREIKFRGFDEENNCWRYGWYTRLVEGARVFDAIICFEDDGVLTRYYIHDDATIGQFTGLHDKNGVEIYDFDIVDNTYLVCLDLIYGIHLIDISNGDIIAYKEGTTHENTGKYFEQHEKISQNCQRSIDKFILSPKGKVQKIW